MLYYMYAADEPLWSAFQTSLAMLLANLVGLANLYRRNSRFAVPREHRDLFEHFSILPPGDFRDLMRHGTRTTLPAGTELTRLGQTVHHMYFVIEGQVEVEKFSERFVLPHAVFIGELGYMTTETATATTNLRTEAEVVVWDVVKLRERAKKQPRLQLSIEAVISRDLAAKVSRAGAPRMAVVL